MLHKRKREGHDSAREIDAQNTKIIKTDYQWVLCVTRLLPPLCQLIIEYKTPQLYLGATFVDAINVENQDWINICHFWRTDPTRGIPSDTLQFGNNSQFLQIEGQLSARKKNPFSEFGSKFVWLDVDDPTSIDKLYELQLYFDKIIKGALKGKFPNPIIVKPLFFHKLNSDGLSQKMNSARISFRCDYFDQNPNPSKRLMERRDLLIIDKNEGLGRADKGFLDNRLPTGKRASIIFQFRHAAYRRPSESDSDSDASTEPVEIRILKLARVLIL